MTHACHGASEPNAENPLDGLDPRYVAFFDCFNAGRFYEAHETLEAVWLLARGTPDARFYQGLIQVAAAFVHFEKQRPAPAVRLLRLAQAHLASYPPVHHRLDLTCVRTVIRRWIERRGQAFDPADVPAQPGPHSPPRLALGAR